MGLPVSQCREEEALIKQEIPPTVKASAARPKEQSPDALVAQRVSAHSVCAGFNMTV